MATPVESIAAFLLTYALHSTLLIGLVWVWMRVRAPRSARLREVLWAFALCGGVISAAAQHGGIVAPHTLTLEWTRSAPQDPVARTVERTSAARRAADVPAAAPGPSVAPSKSIGERVTELATLAAARLRALSFGSSAALAWSVGALAFVLLLALRTSLWRWRQLPARRPVHGDARAALARLAREAGLRRSVRLTASDRLGVPVAFGLLRPEICVPERSLVELDPAQRDAMLAHELAHLVRRDPLRLLLARVLEGVFFFQPLNRLARRRLFEEVEFRCDALAVRWTGQGLSLAACLTQVAEWLRARPTSTGPMTTAMAKHSSALVRRIERLLEDGELDRSERGTRALLLVPLGMLGALVLAAPAIATVAREPVQGFALVEGRAFPAPFASSAGTNEISLVPALRTAAEALDGQLAALRAELDALAADHAAGHLDPAVGDVLAKLQDRLTFLDRARRTLSADIDRLAADEGLDPSVNPLPTQSPRRTSR
ncbi:MAG: M56 family metallopeptidase [Planctomycetes bacterium]|nr:M56 family metallopeptidase [Planctomycetota bacterium]